MALEGEKNHIYSIFLIYLIKMWFNNGPVMLSLSAPLVLWSCPSFPLSRASPPVKVDATFYSQSHVPRGIVSNYGPISPSLLSSPPPPCSSSRWPWCLLAWLLPLGLAVTSRKVWQTVTTHKLHLKIFSPLTAVHDCLSHYQLARKHSDILFMVYSGAWTCVCELINARVLQRVLVRPVYCF